MSVSLFRGDEIEATDGQAALRSGTTDSYRIPKAIIGMPGKTTE